MMPAFKIFLLTAGFMFTIISAQNQSPQVRNVLAVADTVNGIVTISYDLNDSEQDSMEVSLRVSDNSGITYLFPADSVAGDIGYPVLPGTGKQIIWRYDPSLTKLTEKSLASFQAKVIADDLYEIDIQTIVDQVDSNNMLNNLQAIEGVRHFSSGAALWETTNTFIENKFLDKSLQTYRHEFNYNTVTAANIIGRLPGNGEEAVTYIIDGHFDTVPNTPGADDNGSGVVGMLEAMRILSAYHFKNSIVFIGFDLEEVGLVGSLRYVTDAIPAYQQTAGVINFEMIGFTCNEAGCDDFAPLGNYIHNISDVNANPLRQQFDLSAATYVPALNVLSTQADPSNPNFRRSDHARFWDAGIQALFLTDGANFRNHHYHQNSDLISTLNFEFMSNVVKTSVATIATLADVRHIGIGLSNVFVLNMTGTSPQEPFHINNSSLQQNYPNPFNPSTNIEYTLDKTSHVVLRIFNLLGAEVRTLVNTVQPAGAHRVVWDGQQNNGKPASSGVYLYKLENGENIIAKKMTLIR